MLRGVLSLILTMLVSSLGATTYYVATTGNDANAGTSSGSPKLTIQDVLDDYNLGSGDLISVAAGTYSEDAIWLADGDEGFSIVGQGTGSTIYDGDNGNYWMYFSGDLNDNITIKDLKIKDMKASSGAIQFRGNCSGIVFNNVFFENCESSSGRGGALNFNSTGDCGVTVTGCTFTECTVTTPYDGAAIGIDMSTTSFTIDKSIFYNNEALSTYGDGSAMSFEDDMTTASIENCLFYENTAYRYGIIYDDQGATIMNCTFVDNVSSTSYGGLYLTGGETSTVTNCIVTDNSSTDIYVQSGTLNLSYSQYDAHSGATIGTGTTTSSPTFVDAANDDYQLSTGSVGVDSGTDSGAPSDDLLGATRSSTDMGCYELACPTGTWDGDQADNNWSTANNWDIGEVPCGEVVIANVTHQPIITANITCGGPMTINSGADITVSSNTLTVSGAIDNNGSIYIATGTLDANNTIDATGGVIDFTGAGKISVSGAVTSWGTLDESAGTIEYDGGTQNVLADTYNNLEIDQSNAKTAQGAVNVNGTLTVQSGSEYAVAATTTTVSGTADVDGTLSITTGTFNADGSSDIDGTLSISSTGVYDADAPFDATSGNVTFTGAGTLKLLSTVTSLGTLSTDNGTVEYDGGTQNVIADSYYNLEIDQAGTKTAQGTVNANGTLTVQSGATYAVAATTTTITGATDINGTISSSTGTIDANGAFDATGGSVTFTGAGTLAVSGTVTSFGTLSTDNGTVKYDGTTQTILTDTYANLTLDQSGTKSAGGALDVEGDLVTSNSAVFDMSTHDLNIGGNLTIGTANGADFEEADCLVTFDGASNQTYTHAGNSSTVVGATLINHTFESSNGWSTGGSVGGMTFNRVSSPSPFNGDGNATTVWATNPFNDYGSSDGAYVESPSIDMTNWTSMTFSIDVRYNTETNWDGAVIFWSTDNFSTMTRFGSQGEGTNWYNTASIDGPNDRFTEITTDPQGWSGDNSSWQTASRTCPVGMEGESNVKFRVYFGSDGSAEDDGFAFDNVIITGTEAGSGSGSELTNFAINKSGGDLDLGSAIEVDGAMTLTNGIIDASSNAITFANGGTVSGGSVSAHIKGTIIKNTTSTSAFTFPIGNGTDNYEPLTITPNSTSANTWQLVYTVGDQGDSDMHTGLNHVSQAEYWDLSRTSGSDGVVMSFNWDSNDGVTSYADLTVAHYDSGNSRWELIASTAVGSNTSGTITTDAAVTSFSPFAKGSTSAANVLPVSLLSLGAKCADEDVEINWVTASELDNDYFLLEKSDQSGIFDYLGQVGGNGTTTEMSEYSYTDFDYQGGHAYYRLTQYDFDGEKEVFDVITVKCDQNEPETQLSVVSNKGNGYINILGDDLGENVFYELRVFDATGKQIYMGEHFTESGRTDDKVMIYNQASGVYIIQVTVGDKMLSDKAIW